MSSRIFTLLLFSICSAFSSRVLVTFAHDFDSHINSIKPFFLKLVERGHNVTVLDTSSNPKPRYFGPDVHVLPIYLPPKGPKPAHDSFWIVDTASHHLPPLFAATDRVLGDIIEEHKEKLDTVLNTTWDLIIMDEVFGLHQNAISYKLKKEKNVPYIVFSTTITWMSNYINNAMGRFSSSRIGMFVPLPKDSNNFWNPSNFMHRISQFIADFREYFGICYMLSFNGDLDNLKRIASDDFTFSKFTKQSAFHLNEQIDRLPFAVPEAADFKSIGAHCRTPNALSRKYLNFMNDLSSKGTIYVGFGSTIDITFAPEFLWKAFEDTFRNLSDYRIIFAYGGERKMDVGKNVMITKWAPQLEILYHNATMLFISHAGLKRPAKTSRDRSVISIFQKYGTGRSSAHRPNDQTLLACSTV
ncbi:hypothetical protein L596_019391 [Steinernema carpocapsae]|uniref:glucuronosyltransferase n=1 Tax=Steinernema carpocapsae TaxID=34508 RepID=A0A4U5MQK3_STECR|nr:hypothetical protein L596_019391 [Steinernema carpocapsae]